MLRRWGLAPPSNTAGIGCQGCQFPLKHQNITHSRRMKNQRPSTLDVADPCRTAWLCVGIRKLWSASNCVDKPLHSLAVTTGPGKRCSQRPPTGHVHLLLHQQWPALILSLRNKDMRETNGHNLPVPHIWAMVPPLHSQAGKTVQNVLFPPWKRPCGWTSGMGAAMVSKRVTISTILGSTSCGQVAFWRACDVL